LNRKEPARAMRRRGILSGWRAREKSEREARRGTQQMKYSTIAWSKKSLPEDVRQELVNAVRKSLETQDYWSREGEEKNIRTQIWGVSAARLSNAQVSPSTEGREKD